jgi:signal transduction histidine kinase
VLEDLVRTLARIHGERALSISADAPDGLAFRGERQDLEEMAGNLMDNACKWAAARITAKAARLPDGELELCVDDDGPGLDPEDRTRVGERGERLDESMPGSGFGLAIARDIAGLYGGSLELGESPLGGLQVRLKLPRAD